MYEVDTLAAHAGASDTVQAWREWCSGIHGAMSIGLDTTTFDGLTARQRTATYELVTWRSGQQVVARSARHIRRDARERYEILVPLTGTQHVSGTDGAGGDRAIAPGAVAVLPIDTPFQLAHTAGASAVTHVVPADRVDERLTSSGRRMAMHVLDGTGLARVCHDLVVSLVESRQDLSASEFDVVCDRIVDLLGLALAGPGHLSPDTGADAVLSAVRRHVRDHASDPDLSVASMAAEINWSPRYIQAVLARSGTTATELIRAERLDLARDRLLSAAFAGHNVAAIGASVGFGSPSAFAAAFRRRFGATPREVRAGRRVTA